MRDQDRRRYHFARQAHKHNLITFLNAFHGWTMATISATDQAKLRDGFAPLLTGFTVVEFNDLDAALAAIDENTAGFLLEPIQGEGGIRPATHEFLLGLRGLRRAGPDAGVRRGAVRRGSYLARSTPEHYGVTPDIMASARASRRPRSAPALRPRSRCGDGHRHARFDLWRQPARDGRGKVFDIVANEEFLAGVRERGERLRGALEQMIPNHDHLFESVRGVGLMLGIRMKADSRAFVTYLRSKGIPTVERRRQCDARPSAAEHRGKPHPRVRRRSFRSRRTGGASRGRLAMVESAECPPYLWWRADN